VNIFNTWQFNLTGYFITAIAFFQFYKLAVKNSQKDGAATILLQFIASTSVLFLAPLLPFNLPTDIRTYLILLVATIFYTLYGRLQTTSRKHLQVSVYSVINQLTNVFLILIGLTIFREPLITTELFGAGLILSGNLILFYKKDKFELNRYVLIGITATLFLAIAISIDIGISKQFNLPLYIMLTLLVPAMMIFFSERIKISEVIREYNSKDRKYYLVTGIAWGLMIFFTLRAFQLGSVTTIVTLQATSVLLNVLVAYFLLKENDYKMRKIIAAILVIVGVYLAVL
jgi:drug/metabolite transporter (DMT)-like permease